jgi:hypothetical protein
LILVQFTYQIDFFSKSLRKENCFSIEIMASHIVKRGIAMAVKDMSATTGPSAGAHGKYGRKMIA